MDALKDSLLQAWDKLPMEYVRTTIDAWPKRLRATLTRKGGRFEK